MTLPQSIIDAYDEERGRFDSYKGPLFRAVKLVLLDGLAKAINQPAQDGPIYGVDKPKPPSGPGLSGDAPVPGFGVEDCPSRMRMNHPEKP